MAEGRFVVVSLWAARLDRALTTKEEQMLLAELPAERRQRLARLRQPEKRREPLCAYRLLRAALLERYHWQDLPPMDYGPLGKPCFAGCKDVHFSISHTEGAVLVGISDQALGVDIERVRPAAEKLMKRFGSDSPEEFFQSWVRREARAKRTGTPVELGEESSLAPGEQVLYPETFPGFAACVSYQGTMPEKVRRYELEELLRLSFIDR